jgi:hypothetical protein
MEEDSLGHLGGSLGALVGDSLGASLGKLFSIITVLSSSPLMPRVSKTAKLGKGGICLCTVPR